MIKTLDSEDEHTWQKKQKKFWTKQDIRALVDDYKFQSVDAKGRTGYALDYDRYEQDNKPQTDATAIARKLSIPEHGDM